MQNSVGHYDKSENEKLFNHIIDFTRPEFIWTKSKS